MEAFAERARAELRATGAQVLKRPTGTPDLLTAQEALIAKLGISSRSQLARALPVRPEARGRPAM